MITTPDEIALPFTDRIIEFDSREEWLENRSNSIGGSEAASVLGVSPWKSAFRLYGEKRGEVEPEDLSGVRRVRLGSALEPIVLDEFHRETGRETIHWDQSAMVRHSSCEFMTCTPDGLQYRDGELGLIQAKTASERMANAWKEDEPPLYYAVQVQHELEVCDLPFATLVCLIGNDELVLFDIERSQRFGDVLRKQEGEFWRRVLEGDPPEVDGSDSTKAALAAMFPRDTGESIDLPDECSAWDVALQEAKEQIKRYSDIKSDMENRIKAQLKDATYGILPNGVTYSFKTQRRDEHVVRASEFRVLRRKALKQ